MIDLISCTEDHSWFLQSASTERWFLGVRSDKTKGKVCSDLAKTLPNGEGHLPVVKPVESSSTRVLHLSESRAYRQENTCASQDMESSGVSSIIAVLIAKRSRKYAHLIRLVPQFAHIDTTFTGECRTMTRARLCIKKRRVPEHQFLCQTLCRATPGYRYSCAFSTLNLKKTRRARCSTHPFDRAMPARFLYQAHYTPEKYLQEKSLTVRFPS